MQWFCLPAVPKGRPYASPGQRPGDTARAKIVQPQRGRPYRIRMNVMKRYRSTRVALRRPGPPRWGLARGGASITQAVGLGWHRAATLWRKTESRMANGNVQLTLDKELRVLRKRHGVEFRERYVWN